MRIGQPMCRSISQTPTQASATGSREMAASPSRSPTAKGQRRSSARITAAVLNITALTWPRYHADPTSATYQNTVPNPNTAVSSSRTRPVSANRPNSSQASPTVTPAKMQVAMFWWKPVPNRATNGTSSRAGTGG